MKRLVSSVQIALLAGGVALIAACGRFGEHDSPNPVPLEDGASVTTSTGSGMPRPPAGSRRRTTELRSPVGSAVNNFLVDGDFTFTATIEGSTAQSGWLVFGAQGQDYLRIETGGLCRTGLRCGVLESRTILFGRGASSRDRGMVASIYMKPPQGEGCAFGVTAHTIDCGFDDLSAPFSPASEMPGDDGWCRYESRVPENDRGTCFYVDAENFSGRALIDEARLVPDDGTAPSQAKSIAEPWQPSARQRSRITEIGKWVRDHRRFGSPPSPLDGGRPKPRRD